MSISLFKLFRSWLLCCCWHLLCLSMLHPSLKRNRKRLVGWRGLSVHRSIHSFQFTLLDHPCSSHHHLLRRLHDVFSLLLLHLFFCLCPCQNRIRYELLSTTLDYKPSTDINRKKTNENISSSLLSLYSLNSNHILLSHSHQ